MVRINYLVLKILLTLTNLYSTITVFSEPSNTDVQINSNSPSNAMAKFLVFISSKCVHVALKVLLTLQSLLPTLSPSPSASTLPSSLPSFSSLTSSQTLALQNQKAIATRLRIQQLTEHIELYAVQIGTTSPASPSPSKSTLPSSPSEFDNEQKMLEYQIAQVKAKQRQSDYLFSLQDLVASLIDVGRRLETIPNLEARRSVLRQALKSLNDRLNFPSPPPLSPTLRFSAALAASAPSSPTKFPLNESGSVPKKHVLPLAEGLHFPLRLVNDKHYGILKFIDAEASLLKSASRAPFLVYFETATLDTDECNAKPERYDQEDFFKK